MLTYSPIKSAQKQLEAMNNGIVKEAKTNIVYAFTGGEQISRKPYESIAMQSGGGYGMLRHPAVQSKSQVEVRIKSDKPVEIAKVHSDKNTELMLDTGELFGSGF